jgi:NADH-quinone oxidoreductase subunit M
MSKIPTLPLHIWLPEAHVEAPTIGSVLLAGILLKISGYGILRILYSTCTFVSMFEIRMLAVVVLSLSILYSVLCALVQVDLKKIIAYSSIVHMNFSFLGLFIGSSIGYIGSIFLMFSHGLISAGLFFCVGMLYDRFKTRNLLYYGGLVQFMPIFSTIFFLLIISNFSFPGTCNFIGEMFVFIAIFEESLGLFILCSVSMVLVLIFCLNILIKTLFFQITGFIKSSLIDLNIVESYIGASLIVYIIFFGLNPGLLINLFTVLKIK